MVRFSASTTLKVFAFALSLAVLFPKPAHAYLDPGSGSYLFQLLIAGLLGSMFFLRGIVKRIKKIFGIDEKKTEESNKSSKKP